MNLHEWATRWGVSPAALADLRARLVAVNTDPAAPSDTTTEAGAQDAVRLEASAKGGRLWRNNLGATIDNRGNYLRYGLANDSKQMNELIKSSDLIGIRPVTVAGVTIGQFMAREIKAPGWVYKGTKREQAQLRFLELVAGLGGDAQFSTGEGTI